MLFVELDLVSELAEYFMKGDSELQNDLKSMID
jgi:hypothetical protein